MIPEIISQWDKNKAKLEDYFTQEHPYNYNAIVKELFNRVISDPLNNEMNFDVSRMTVIFGDYPGTEIFIIPKYSDIAKEHRLEVWDYLITRTYYGSCYACDKLLKIKSSDCLTDGKPSLEQVKGYMLIALHLVQELKWLAANENENAPAEPKTPIISDASSSYGLRLIKDVRFNQAVENESLKQESHSIVQSNNFCDYCTGKITPNQCDSCDAATGDIFIGRDVIFCDPIAPS